MFEAVPLLALIIERLVAPVRALNLQRSSESWAKAAANAVETAGRTVRDLRVAEATRFDVTIQDGKVAEYRVRLDISFKYEGT